MQEMLPVMSGLFLGSLLGLLCPSLRVPIGVVLIIAFAQRRGYPALSLLATATRSSLWIAEV